MEFQYEVNGCTQNSTAQLFNIVSFKFFFEKSKKKLRLFSISNVSSIKGVSRKGVIHSYAMTPLLYFFITLSTLPAGKWRNKKPACPTSFR